MALKSSKIDLIPTQNLAPYGCFFVDRGKEEKGEFMGGQRKKKFNTPQISRKTSQNVLGMF